jgi:mercuric reductase
MVDSSGYKKAETYDIAVIGAGSAGFSAAITAADEGASVALIGHGMIGGTCVNIGCVPSKTMIRAAEALQAGRVAKRFPGLAGKTHLANWEKLMAAKDDLVSTLRQKKYIDLLPNYESINYIEGKACLTKDGVLVDGAAIKANKMIIATGSRPAVPPIAGLEKVETLDSTAALELSELPDSLLVIGGGVIGCELGQMFARMGTKVTICCRSRLLPEMEPEVSEALQAALEEEGITICAGVNYQKVEQTPQGVKLYLQNQHGKQIIEVEKILLATGRHPNIENLGLEDQGVQLTRYGGIKVDQYMQTTNPSVYAAGDVTGRDMFVYMAAYGAKLAAKNALQGNRTVYDNSTMPSVVFTDPQVARVGMTQQMAQAAGHKVKTSLIGLDNVPRALAARDTRGLIKLVADEENDRLLGAHIIAPEGADSIQTAALAIKFAMTATQLGETIFPYLTTVEGLKLAAQSFGKDVNKLSCCAG